MFLQLEKQSIVSLSSDEMKTIRGGGKPRSDRRTGRCAFSRRHGVTAEKDENGVYVATGCLPACSAPTSPTQLS
ncbi:MAG: hypothetical protein ACFB10_20750 [Salibacteraceae bacterium]